MIYRTICTQLWTDPKVQQLSVQGKCLFLYLITNPQTHLSGIYSLSLPLVHEQTGLSYTLCHTLLDTLSKLELIRFDASTKVVWVKKMFGYQGRGPKNELACAHHLATLHHSSLIPQFLDAYPMVKSHLSDTLSHTLYDTPSTFGPSVPDPDPSSVLVIRKERSGEKTNGKTAFPQDWTPTAEDLEPWRKFGINPTIEFAAFRDHAKSIDRRLSDWKAGFRNWCRKAIQLKERRA